MAALAGDAPRRRLGGDDHLHPAQVIDQRLHLIVALDLDGVLRGHAHGHRGAPGDDLPLDHRRLNHLRLVLGGGEADEAETEAVRAGVDLDGSELRVTQRLCFGLERCWRAEVADLIEQVRDCISSDNDEFEQPRIYRAVR